MRIEKDVTEVLALRGNNHLGGDDFDRLVVDSILARLPGNLKRAIGSLRLPGKRRATMASPDAEEPPMPAATLTEKGQIVIPVEIRTKYGLTPGTQVEFIDEGGVIRLVARRRVTPSDPEGGYGMIKLKATGKLRRLAEFDAASVVRKNGRGPA